MGPRVKRLIRLGAPAGLLVGLLSAGTPRRRAACAALLAGYWAAVYAAYRQGGRRRSAEEYERLRSASLEAYARHYNERVPTIEEEFDLWGDYHRHRHEMRYGLLAQAVRAHLPAGGRVLDLGCGSALLADRVIELAGHYVGVDYGGHHVAYAAKRLPDRSGPLRCTLGRAEAERLPFPDTSFDVVVMSEVIEHLMRPELAVWEVARVLRPGGVFVMTTNNACEAPLRSPLSHLLAWLEKAAGAEAPWLISYRPWIWPEPVDPALLPAGIGPVYLPHTHHIPAETKALFGTAGLRTFHWSTFEFPPPQSATARWLDRHGHSGELLADGIEWVARRTPVVRRLGCHLLMLSRKTGPPIAPNPPPGIWPGPFSGPLESRGGAGGR